jgi:hypothetical protein
MAFQQTRVGDLLVLAFPGAGQVPGLSPPPPHVLSISGGTNLAALGIPRGVHVHVWQLDQRVIVDVYAPVTPPPTAGQQPAAAANASPPPGGPPVAAAPLTPVKTPEPAAPAAPPAPPATADPAPAP